MVLGSSQVTVLAPSASMGAMWSHPPPHVPRINQLIKYHGHRLSAIEAIWSHPPPHVPSINQLIKYHLATV
jgi:hypothetical protein